MMVSDTWFSEIESTIFTHLEYRLVERFNAPFPQLKCTTSSQNETISNIADFPTLYVHMLPPVETGNDLLNEDVIALRVTFELQIYSDKSESECVKIMNQCILEMKKLHFNITMFPDPQTINKKYLAIARFTRLVASGDQDIVLNYSE